MLPSRKFSGLYYQINNITFNLYKVKCHSYYQQFRNSPSKSKDKFPKWNRIFYLEGLVFEFTLFDFFRVHYYSESIKKKPNRWSDVSKSCDYSCLCIFYSTGVVHALGWFLNITLILCVHSRQTRSYIIQSVMKRTTRCLFSEIDTILNRQCIHAK